MWIMDEWFQSNRCWLQTLIDEVTAAAGQKKSPDLPQLVEPHGSSAERKAAAMGCVQ